MTTESTRTPTRTPRRWPWISGIIAALIAGLLIGSAGETEPVAAEPETVEVEVPGEIPAAELEALEAREAAVAETDAQLAEISAELDAYAVELDERETAITETEESIAANTVGDGVWTVGPDIEPGTYRATDVSSDCYWAVLVTGTNGADIVDNGIPGGGNPTVTVAEGHDFESARCGEWVRQ